MNTTACRSGVYFHVMIEGAVRRVVAACKTEGEPEVTENELINRLLLALQLVLKTEGNAEAALAQTKRRLGLADRSVYVEEARIEMEGNAPPDWVVILSSQSLPHGGRHWIRVKVSAAPEPSGTVETRSVPGWICDPDPIWDSYLGPVEEMIVHIRCLESDECLPILNILRNATPDDLRKVREDRKVIDGCPCELVVVSREPRQHTLADFFNLCSIRSAALLNQPAVKLARLLLTLRANPSKRDWLDAGML